MKNINKNNNRPQHEAGFTFYEVMIAMAIASIMVLSLISVQTSSVSGNTTARLTSEASTYAVDQMERLLSLPFTNAGLDAGTNSQRTAGDFTIRWSVSAGATTNTRLITVTVSSANRNMGTRRNVTLTSIKSAAI